MPAPARPGIPTLREGDRNPLEAALRPHRLLFLCTANICRSPMAEGWARALAERGGLRVEVRSAGVAAREGLPPDPLAIRVMGEASMDISGQRSRPLNEIDLAWADHILVMELRHQRSVLDRCPEAGERLLMLGTFGGIGEVPDPVGGWRWRFRGSRDQIGRCVAGLLKNLPPEGRADR